MVTAAAYKFAISTMVPPVAYLTLIDRYVLMLWMIMLLCAVKDAVLGIRAEPDHPLTPPVLILGAKADYGATLVLCSLLLALHLFYACKLQRMCATRGDDLFYWRQPLRLAKRVVDDVSRLGREAVGSAAGGARAEPSVGKRIKRGGSGCAPAGLASSGASNPQLNA